MKKILGYFIFLFIANQLTAKQNFVSIRLKNSSVIEGTLIKKGKRVVSLIVKRMILYKDMIDLIQEIESDEEKAQIILTDGSVLQSRIEILNNGKIKLLDDTLVGKNTTLSKEKIKSIRLSKIVRIVLSTGLSIHGEISRESGSFYEIISFRKIPIPYKITTKEIRKIRNKKVDFLSLDEKTFLRESLPWQYTSLTSGYGYLLNQSNLKKELNNFTSINFVLDFGLDFIPNSMGKLSRLRHYLMPGLRLKLEMFRGNSADFTLKGTYIGSGLIWRFPFFQRNLGDIVLGFTAGVLIEEVKIPNLEARNYKPFKWNTDIEYQFPIGFFSLNLFFQHSYIQDNKYPLQAIGGGVSLSYHFAKY